MKSLTKFLEEARRHKVVRSYNLETFETELANYKSEATVRLTINDLTIITKSIIYNTKITKFSSVTDMLFDQILSQLFTTGMMALYSNLTEKEYSKIE